MWLHTVYVYVAMGLLFGIVTLRFVVTVMFLFVYEVNILRKIIHLEVRRIFQQSVTPGAFKSDVADTKVCLTMVDVYQLFRSRVIAFWTCSLGHDAYDVEILSGNSLGKIPDRLYGYTENRFSPCGTSLLITTAEHGKEPSAAYMQQLVNKCRNENVKVVFISKEHSGRAAQRIANELGAKVVNINPLDYDVPAQMKMIAKSLK